ncbi:hypothetical protein Taro_041798, partial [Colocasia esculenta]|nr:hypothetical protein [Colocasia esculenta]
QLFENSNGVQEDFLKWFRRYIEELKAANDLRCTDDIEMALDGGSYSGSRPRRQRITVQQTFPTHSASEGSAAAASMVGSTTSVAGPVSSQVWGRGHGRWAPPEV